jgi:regulator of RNase E activity RraA
MNTPDDVLFVSMRKDLFTAVVGDTLDEMGFLHQFLPPYIQPLHSDMILVGRAMTVQHHDLEEEAPTNQTAAFGVMLKALDDLKRGEVYIATGSSPTYALIGEHMSARAKRLGCVGAVIDGYSRDTRGILNLGFPVFSRGRYAQDQRPRGRVVDFRTTITIGGVGVTPGDIIFGDIDGVLAIPQVIEQEVLRRAMERVQREHDVGNALDGRGISAAEAIEQFGIL